MSCYACSVLSQVAQVGCESWRPADENIAAHQVKVATGGIEYLHSRGEVQLDNWKSDLSLNGQLTCDTMIWGYAFGKGPVKEIPRLCESKNIGWDKKEDGSPLRQLQTQ